MITYSVWNPSARSFDYYASDEARPIHAPNPPKRSIRSMGATPEEAAWRVPSGAYKVGSGTMPKGRVATLDGDAEAAGLSLPSWWPLAAVGLALLVWRSR